MSDWKEYSLGDISRNISRRFDFNAYPNVVFINTGDVLNNQFLHCDISNVKDLPGQAKKAIKKGDILYSEIRPGNGRYLFVDNDLDNYVVSTKFMVIEPNANIVLPEFLFLLLISNETTEYFKMIAESRSGTFPQITFDSVSSLSLNIPNKETQQKILDIITPLDDKIELNTQINQTLEQIAQALFKSWFVDFDPVRAKVQALSDGLSLEQAELAAMQAISGKTPEELTALSQTQPERYAELAETAKAFPCEMVAVDGVEVPKGWNLKALDEIANYQNGLALQKFRPEDDEPFLPVVKIAQLRQGYADGEEKAKASIKPECIIDNGDVIFSWSGSLLVDIWCGGKAALNQHLFKVTSKRYPKWFYYFYTKYHLAEFQRIAYDKAVTMGHIKREHLSAAKCVVPNDELLANKSLENILEKIIFNRLENFNLQNTRDLLLPKLLNGEI